MSKALKRHLRMIKTLDIQKQIVISALSKVFPDVRKKITKDLK